MNYQFTINIKEIAEHRMGFDDRKELIKYILFDLMQTDASNEVMRDLLDDMMQGEQEFDNRPNVVEAYKTLIEILK